MATIREGLGGAARPLNRPVVWLDCSTVGFADLGHARADLVLVPGWGDRAGTVAALAEMRSHLRLVVEVDAVDPDARRLLAACRAGVRIVWREGASGRRATVDPSTAARWALRPAARSLLASDEGLRHGVERVADPTTDVPNWRNEMNDLDRLSPQFESRLAIRSLGRIAPRVAGWCLLVAVVVVAVHAIWS